MSEDHVHQPFMRDTWPDPEALGFREAIPGESSIRRRGNLVRRFLGKDKNGLTEKIVHFSRNLHPVLSNVDGEGAPNIEVADVATNLQTLRKFDSVARTHIHMQKGDWRC
ncbi:hypothetical protein DFJ58DRAFT_843268 [Suillus subalutaceus]|uniref:uncharacterized protein n=1 Tax=Suillus subalutaceus TaxID=48586 RepID=UPI001B8661C1|nr:uncharacterized protein DFJ58DRAFT_843268 [Suillus subalutaceus]KAG1847178.1 hypothetical protein DFJ58DRAFT_843268 [Suillus subalutaceus]